MLKDYYHRKPIIIIGESVLELKSSKYIIEGLKKLLKDNNFANKEWNALNFLPQNASTVGLIDLKVIPKKDEEDNSFFEKLATNKFKLIYLLGSDNLEIKKNKEFIIYQGSHGDRGAEIADLVLPSAAFTEQSGLYENLEGRVQECKSLLPYWRGFRRLEDLQFDIKKIRKERKYIKF